MKTLTSNIENSWIEIKSIEITEEQREVLRKGTDAEKITLHAELKALKEVAASDYDASFATSLYATVKPVVEEGVSYQFISMDITTDETTHRGILNYRLNNEHKQIRF